MRRDSGVEVSIAAVASLAVIAAIVKRGTSTNSERREEYRHMMTGNPGHSRASRRAGSPAMSSRTMFGEAQRRRELERAQVLPFSQAAQPLFHRLAKVPQGTSVQLLLKSEALSVPELEAAGMLHVVDAEPIEGVGWYSYTVKPLPALYRLADAIKSAREAYRQEFLQVGLFPRR
jgi:hypothetical protein